MKNFFNAYKIPLLSVVAAVLMAVCLYGILGFLTDVSIEQIHREVMMENVDKNGVVLGYPDRELDVIVDGKKYKICIDYHFTPLYGKRPPVPNKMHNSIVYKEEEAAFKVWARKKYDVYYSTDDYLDLFDNPEYALEHFKHVFSGFKRGSREDRLMQGERLTGEELGVPELLKYAIVTLHDESKYKELPARNYTDWFTVFVERFNGPFDFH
ncbi:hypothetical protein KAR91_63035 [Candidatus Pacearchaeota archaeon]|nr:hypothetical protein [Candidatus Pacearchaeota archaeon]